MQIKELIKEAHENAVNKGFWEEERTIGEQIALMHSELSEALEEARKFKTAKESDKRFYQIEKIYYSGENYISTAETKICKKPEGFPIELADTVIRIFDTCGKYGIDLEKAIEIKMAYNKTQPQKHGKNF